MEKKIPAERKNIVRLLDIANNKIAVAVDMLKRQHCNDAISKAYYAFFYAARAALLHENFFAKTHKGVIMLFERHYIKTGKFPVGIGRWLNKARDAREEADYDLWKEYSKEQVETAIKAAKEFVKNIEKILKC